MNQKSKMAGDGDREMVLANFQVNRWFGCILRVFFWTRIIFLISDQSITGIENLDECITLLDHHNWDLTVGSNFTDEVYILIAFSSVFLICQIQMFFLGLCELSSCRRDRFAITVCAIVCTDVKWCMTAVKKQCFSNRTNLSTAVYDAISDHFNRDLFTTSSHISKDVFQYIVLFQDTNYPKKATTFKEVFFIISNLLVDNDKWM